MGSITRETEERIKRDAEFFDRMQTLAQKVVTGEVPPQMLREEAATIMRDIYRAEYQSAWRDIFEHNFGPIEQFDFEAVAA
jgi:hypothetical protein